MNLRRIQDCDWDRIYEIQQQSYPEDFLESKESLQAKHLCSSDTCFVIEINNIVEGYLLAMPYERGESPSLNSGKHHAVQSDNLHLHDFCLSRQCKNLGYGKKIIHYLLMSPSMHYFKTISLVSVMESKYFWESIGFSLLDDKTSLDLTTYGHDAYYLSMALA